MTKGDGVECQGKEVWNRPREHRHCISEQEFSPGVCWHCLHSGSFHMLSRKSCIWGSPRALERCVLHAHHLGLIWQLPGGAMAHTTLDHKPALAWDQAPHWHRDVCEMNAQSREVLRKGGKSSSDCNVQVLGPRGAKSHQPRLTQ